MNNIAVVITCYNLGRTLEDAIKSALAQTRQPSHIIVIDEGSTDAYTRHLLATTSWAGVRVIRTPNQGVAAARNLGVRLTDEPYLLMLDADDMLEPDYFKRAAALLDEDSELSFVTCGLSEFDDPEDRWQPPSCGLIDLLSYGATHIATVFRRTMWETLGGFDERLTCLEDADFWVAAAGRGFRGTVIDAPLVRYRRRTGSRSDRALRPETHVTTMATILAKNESAVERHWLDLLLAKEQFLLDQRAHTEYLDKRRADLERSLGDLRSALDRAREQLTARGRSALDMGDLRRVMPLSQLWGFDRGNPIDRYYIERFLTEHQADIRGDVLEVKDSGYTARFGGSAVSRSDVIDIEASNQGATLIADLTQSSQLPANQYDCFICTQSLLYIYDVQAAIEGAFQMLKPGGVLLCTLPAVSRVSYEDGGPDGDYWRFTEASALGLFAEVFPIENLQVSSFGNVLAAVSLLHGIAVHELAPSELEARDPFFPLTIAIRAIKPTEDQPERLHVEQDTRTRPPVVVLAYHRVAGQQNDVSGLGVFVDRFQEHIRGLLRHFEIVPLDELTRRRNVGSVERGLVALTFDDGTRDHLTHVAPFLSVLGVPATYFVTTDGLDEPHEHYWDILEELFTRNRTLPSELTASVAGNRMTLQTAADVQRRHALRALDDVLAPLSDVQRREVLHELYAWCGARPRVRDDHRVLMTQELMDLSRLPHQTIGCHSIHHLVLPAQPVEIQALEIVDSRLDLERRLGKPVVSFCYPYGLWSRQTEEIVRCAGYEVAVVVDDRAVADDDRVLRLPRVEVKNESLESLLARLQQPSVRARGGG